jgi:transcriptional regulator with XRE-family HTH domain
MTIGARLREQRQKSKLSLGQVGEYEGVSPQYLSDLERGRNHPSVWDLLARLAQRYGCTTDYLLGLDAGPEADVFAGLDAATVRELQALIADLRQLTPAERQRVLAAARTIQRLYEPHIVGEDDAPGDAPGAAS